MIYKKTKEKGIRSFVWEGSTTLSIKIVFKNGSVTDIEY